VAVVQDCLDRISERDEAINAFVTVLEDEALDRAREVKQSIEAGETPGPLHGVPVAIKDAYAYKAGVRNTFGSRAMTDFVPESSAPLVERLEAAGAIIVGKTNTPEFASKGVTDNGLIGRTKNPFDPERHPNGSSGGSAAAVASGMVPLAQGSDHAGSIRGPASACNLVGVFPSPGRVPQGFRPDAFKYDLPYVSSGPLARTVTDAALFLDAVAGPHPAEPYSLPDTVDFTDAVTASVSGHSIAYSPEFSGFHVSESVRDVVGAAVESFERAGARVDRVDPAVDDWDEPHRALTAGLEVLFANFAENLSAEHGIDLLERRDQIDQHVVERIEAGYEYDAVSYKQSNVARTTVFDALQSVFETHDLLITPTVAVPPVRADTGPPESVDGHPLERVHDLVLTWPVNLTGHPAASVPAGLVDGLPVGMQIIGPRFDDRAVIAAAAAIEGVRPWDGHYP
jgi:Asp-tRNA(Asn)/Glu-tRNA(Gln) amidotransferase A subunit family amidase